MAQTGSDPTPRNTMSDNATFGDCQHFPEPVRVMFLGLCQDVASLHAKWRLYLDLFSSREDTAILSDLARGSFQLIEEALRSDMTMAVCRLSDPAQSCGNDNLSIPTLAQRFGSVQGLDSLLQQFRDECEPLRRYRNKRIGHNDLTSALNPKANPLPGIGRPRIETILQLASQILNAVYRSVVDGELAFQPFLIGSGRDLVHWLRIAKQHQAEELQRLVGQGG